MGLSVWQELYGEVMWTTQNTNGAPNADQRMNLY